VLVTYLRSLAGKDRSPSANWHLGFLLAFVAGAANAGGFLAVNQYTSHMSGIISAIADEAALSNVVLALAGIVSLASFVFGAACSAVMINWGRRKRLHSRYALPILLEALLLLCFGLLGSNLMLWKAFFVPIAVVLLCFMMGLQNAIITKLSNVEIRATHMTGVVTDLGIELGKLLYWNSNRISPSEAKVSANWKKIRLLGTMLTMFILGGFAGAIGFRTIGYSATIWLSALLVGLTVVPIIDDLRGWLSKQKN
jgi:uncharacterized membrane protein YoaK (UPF0700 family)